MSDEGRRVFPMETALGLVAGKDCADVLDFLSYAAGRSVDEDSRQGVAPMVKGWLYALNPDFAKTEFNENIGYDNWVSEQKRKLGDNLSITPMGGSEQKDVNAILGYVENARLTAQDKTDEATAAVEAQQAAEAEAKSMSPFKKKAEDLEKKVAQLEEKNKALSSEVSELKETVKSFDGKVPIDEKEIEKSVKDIVTRAVKNSLGGLLAAGAGAAVAGEADADAPAGFDDDGSSSSDGVPDNFGFGASGSDDSGFGF